MAARHAPRADGRSVKLDLIEKLQSQFGIDGAARFERAEGDLIRLAINTPQAEAHVYLHGAHVSHFQPAEGAAVLFMSERSQFGPGKPIRGGVPVCFPWFGVRADEPDAPNHGFARHQQWNIESVEQTADGSVCATLQLDFSDRTRALWPYEFRLRYVVTVGQTLTMAIETINGSDQPFKFEQALHTYFAVPDVRRTAVHGLGQAEYLDKVDRHQPKHQGDAPLKIESETDRVYIGTEATCVLEDEVGDRQITIKKSGSNNTVVWNPWIAKAQRMPDFGDDEWSRMLCIETCNVADHAVTLGAGASHTMSATITVGSRD